MERESLTKGYEQTFQLEQYQPVKSSVIQTVLLDEDDDPDEVADLLHRENVAIVSRDIAARIAAYEMKDGLTELLEAEAGD